MPRNNLQVEVKERKENDKRVIEITIRAPEEDFLLGDLLAQRKAILPCAAALKDVATEGIKSWCESAEQVVAGTRNDQNTVEAKTTKRERKPKSPGAQEDRPTGRLDAKPVNGAMATSSVSGD